MARSRERRRRGTDPGPKYIVYGLVDPRTLGIEYIGKSSSGLTRPKTHRYPKSLRHNTAKNTWLRELLGAGLDYDIVILGSVGDPHAPGTLCWWWGGNNTTALCDLERWFIAYGRASGWTLRNGSDGGDGASYGALNPMRRPDVVVKCSEAVRRFNDERARERCGTDLGYAFAVWRIARDYANCGPCDSCEVNAKRCVVCGDKLTRKLSENWVALQKRSTCSPQCRAEYTYKQATDETRVCASLHCNQTLVRGPSEPCGRFKARAFCGAVCRKQAREDSIIPLEGRLCAELACKRVLTRRSGETVASFNKRTRCSKRCHAPRQSRFRPSKDRTCASPDCQEQLVQRPDERTDEFNRRKTCGPNCYHQTRRAMVLLRGVRVSVKQAAEELEVTGTTIHAWLASNRHSWLKRA